MKHQAAGVESSGQYATRFDVETVPATRRPQTRPVRDALGAVGCWVAGWQALESEAQLGEPDFEYSRCGDSFRLLYQTCDSVAAVTRAVR